MFGLVKKSRLETAEARIDQLQANHKTLRGQVSHVKQDRAALREGLTAVARELPTLDKAHDSVQQLDTPHVAYKATEGCIVTLLLPDGTTVVHPTVEAQARERFMFDKLRVDQAIPIELTRTSGDPARKHPDSDQCLSTRSFRYYVGKKATPNNQRLEEDTEIVCASGIHVFRTAHAARQWKDSRF